MGDLAPRASVTAILAKGLANQLPIIGGLLTEVLNEVIPNQRVDRLERMFEHLEKRLGQIDGRTVRDRFREPVFVDLLEDGMWQAARAVDDERLQQIASVLAEGLSADRATALGRKALLALLGQLNDAEVIVLSSYLGKNRTDEGFNQRHRAVLEPPSFPERASFVEDRAAVYDYGRQHLALLGLLSRKDTKAAKYQLTSLGRVLLKAIGAADAFDR